MTLGTWIAWQFLCSPYEVHTDFSAKRKPSGNEWQVFATGVVHNSDVLKCIGIPDRYYTDGKKILDLPFSFIFIWIIDYDFIHSLAQHLYLIFMCDGPDFTQMCPLLLTPTYTMDCRQWCFNLFIINQSLQEGKTV